MTDIVARLSVALADRYRLERELGQGGMATVYLAEDLRHRRKVAVKLLRPELAAVLGADRFVQEITTTASLQHPHILPLFDSGSVKVDGRWSLVDGQGAATPLTKEGANDQRPTTFLYYVMPYVEGETLRAKLDREKQLDVTEAVRLATDVADALDYAHRHGVIHRDIKPENILLHDGRPMVADFGIALAVSAAAGGRMTETGLSLGTPHYMSPEQATAEKEITGRSDVYSLASVLYEMLAGQPPHIGGSAQQIIMKIIAEEARPVTELRRSVPPNVAAALDKALERLPADRFPTAKAFAEALGDPGFRTGAALASGPRAALAPARRAAPLAVLGVVALAALGFGAVEWRAAHRGGPSDVVRFDIDLPPSILFANAITSSNVAISPDGRSIAYAVASDNGATRIYIRRLDEAEPHPIAGTEGAQQPCFSPDGRWIAYLVGTNVWKVAVVGGMPVPVGSIRLTAVGLTWSSAGLILAGTSEGLLGLSPGGGEARIVAATDRTAGDLFFNQARALPDGKRVLLATQGAGGFAGERLAMVSLADGKVTRFPLNVYDPLGVVDGHLVYVQSSGTLMAVPIDLAAGRITGNPVNLGITVSTTVSGASQAALSPTGTLIYQALAAKAALGWVSSSGDFQPVWAEPQPYSYPRLSPDGRRIAVTVGAPGFSDVWIYDIASGTPIRITNQSGGDERAEWTPDGGRLLYRHSGLRSDLWWVPADQSAPATPVEASAMHQFYEGVITPDGRDLVYQQDDAGPTQADVLYRALTGDTAAHPVAATPAIEAQARVSPDGKWVAYVTDASGASQVVVRPFPGPGGQVQVSVAGGAEPVWSRDGKRLFYRDGRHMIAAAITTTPQFAVRSRTNLFADEYQFAPAPHADYDVSPDGTRFLMAKSAERPELVVVYGWSNALRQQLRNAGGR